MNDKRNYRACVGAIILLVISGLGLITSFVSNMSTMLGGFAEGDTGRAITALTSELIVLANNVPLLILTVMLVAKVRSMALTVMAAITLVLKLIVKLVTLPSSFISYAVVMNGSVIVPVVQVIYSVAYLAFLLSLVILCAKATGKNPASARKLKALPGILYIVSGVLSAAVNVVSSIGNLLPDVNGTVLVLGITMALSTLAVEAVHAVLWFLIGNWIANPYKKGYMPYAPAQNPYPQQPPYNGGWQG